MDYQLMEDGRVSLNQGPSNSNTRSVGLNRNNGWDSVSSSNIRGWGSTSSRRHTQQTEFPNEHGINKVAEDINSWTQSLYSCVERLNANEIGGPKDTPELRRRLRVASADATRNVRNIHSAFQEIGTNKMASSSKKFHKLKREFEEVYTQLEEAQKNVRRKLRNSIKLSSNSDILMKSVTGNKSSIVDIDSNFESSNRRRESRDFVSLPPQQQLLHAFKPIDVERTRLEEDEKDAAQLYQDSVGLQELMQDLGIIVESQGQKIVEIDDNIAAGTTRTGDAASALTGAEKSDRAARKKRACFILLCLGGLVFLLWLFWPSLFKKSH